MKIGIVDRPGVAFAARERAVLSTAAARTTLVPLAGAGWRAAASATELGSVATGVAPAVAVVEAAVAKALAAKALAPKALAPKALAPKAVAPKAVAPKAVAPKAMPASKAAMAVALKPATAPICAQLPSLTTAPRTNQHLFNRTNGTTGSPSWRPPA